MHDLRVSKLTNLHEEGVSLSDLQKISGHTNLTTLSRYLKVDEAKVFEAEKVRNMLNSN